MWRTEKTLALRRSRRQTIQVDRQEKQKKRRSQKKERKKASCRGVWAARISFLIRNPFQKRREKNSRRQRWSLNGVERCRLDRNRSGRPPPSASCRVPGEPAQPGEVSQALSVDQHSALSLSWHKRPSPHRAKRSPRVRAALFARNARDVISVQSARAIYCFHLLPLPRAPHKPLRYLYTAARRRCNSVFAGRRCSERRNVTSEECRNNLQ